MPVELVGKSLEGLRSLLPALAAEEGPIVITGEPGSGKTLFAELLHACRPAPAGPFRWLNFLLLSEREQRIGLFGAEPPEHSTSKRSILEISGTALLKHVDSAGPYLQRKLAAALDLRTFSRLCGSKQLPVAARLVFTLRETVDRLGNARRLEPPLARLLAGCRTVSIPPLRERAGDIPELAEALLQRHGKGLDPALYAMLGRQPYRDNVRDLIAALASMTDRPAEERARPGAPFELTKILAMIACRRESSLPQALRMIERGILEQAAIAYGEKRAEIALMLGMTERDVRRKLARPPGAVTGPS